MIDSEVVLGLMLMMAPYDPPQRLAHHAEIIATEASTREEAAAMIVVSFFETTFGRSGIPWGASASGRCRNSHFNPQTCARVFLNVWRRTESLCGRRLERRFALWHHGRCSDIRTYERRETRRWHWLIRRL